MAGAGGVCVLSHSLDPVGVGGETLLHSTETEK